MPRTKKSTPLAEISYPHNFLKEVIVRIDFVTPLSNIDEKLPKRIMNAARKMFPIVEQESIVERQFEVTYARTVTEEKKAYHWHFYSLERDKRLTIAPDFMFIQYFKYTEFEILQQEFLQLFEVIVSHFEDTQIKRLGLRYINHVTLLSDSGPFDWTPYLAKHLTDLLKAWTNQSVLSRVFHIVEFNYGDFNLRYQFGMPNPDYPAPIRQKHYVLDMDASYLGLQEKDEITKNLTKFHDRIQELFETSITDKLRAIMKEDLNATE